MKYVCAPSNFREESLESYSKLNAERKGRGIKVQETYGCTFSKEFGSGRNNETVHTVGFQRLKEFVKHSHRCGIEFNYTLNSVDYSRHLYSSRGIRRLLTFVERIVKCDVDSITIAVPPLIQAVHLHFPHVRITASVIQRFATLDKLRVFEDFGARRVVLLEDVTRNFEKIRRFRKNTDLEFEMLVNSDCPPECAIRDFHYQVQGQPYSVGKVVEGEFNINHWVCAFCSSTKQHDIQNFLKRPGFIRPEDLGVYEKEGVEYFKIIGREKNVTSDPIVHLYMTERNNGDFFDIFNLRYTNYLDNRLLDGFIDFWVSGKAPCGKSNECIDTENEVLCGYCTKMGRHIRFSRRDCSRTVAVKKREMKSRLTGIC